MSGWPGRRIVPRPAEAAPGRRRRRSVGTVKTMWLRSWLQTRNQSVTMVTPGRRIGGEGFSSLRLSRLGGRLIPELAHLLSLVDVVEGHGGAPATPPSRSPHHKPRQGILPDPTIGGTWTRSRGPRHDSGPVPVHPGRGHCRASMRYQTRDAVNRVQEVL